MARSDPAVQENEVNKHKNLEQQSFFVYFTFKLTECFKVTAGFHAMLEELKINSRPHLTTLTILPGEYRQYASQVISDSTKNKFSVVFSNDEWLRSSR